MQFIVGHYFIAPTFEYDYHDLSESRNKDPWMREYDPRKPLACLHVPKCGGTSALAVFRQWFGENLFEHYGVNARKAQNLDNPPDPTGRVAIYGHFNTARGVGLEAVYPHIAQSVTILRDPWNRAVSGYYYRKARTHIKPEFAWVDDMCIEEYLSNYPYQDPKYGPPMWNFMPRPCTLETYQDVLNTWCVSLGITERMTDTLSRIARDLDQPLDPSLLGHKNRSERDPDEPDALKPAFRKRNALDYALYEFAERYVASD